MTRGRALAVVVTVWLGACGEYGGADRSWTGGGASPGAPPSGESRDAADPTEGDSYEPVGTNPFVSTEHDPFSTFAADVDTASYDLFVRDVGNYGVLPDPDSVRLEEYVNYFDYEDPAPEPGAEHPFAITLESAPHPMGREYAMLRVGIQAEEPPPFVKLPSNIVFLVDVSGSMMSADKLPLVQILLRETLTALDPDDTVSIVTYAGSTGVALPPTPVSDAEIVRDAIDGLVAGGGTAGGAGIQLAYEQAEAGFLDGGINHVVLCTDGDFNIGISDTEELVSLIEEKRETGVTLTALGFGAGNLNDAMMERVSNAGNGIYSVIVNEDRAVRYAHDNMLRTMVHVAKDMKIQVELNPEHVLAYRLLGYENRAIADIDFRNDAVDAGEVGAGHHVTALYEVVLHGQSVPMVDGAPALDEGEAVEGQREIGSDELVLVKVRYRRLAESADDPAHEVSSAIAPSAFAVAAASADLEWASAMAALAEMLKASPYANDADLFAVQSIVDAQAGRDFDRAELAELLAEVRRVIGR